MRSERERERENTKIETVKYKHKSNGILVSSKQFTYLINCWHDCNANCEWSIIAIVVCLFVFIAWRVNAFILFVFYWLRRRNKFGNGSNCILGIVCFFMTHLGFYEHVSLALLNAFVCFFIFIFCLVAVFLRLCYMPIVKEYEWQFNCQRKHVQ